MTTLRGAAKSLHVMAMRPKLDDLKYEEYLGVSNYLIF